MPSLSPVVRRGSSVGLVNRPDALPRGQTPKLTTEPLKRNGQPFESEERTMGSVKSYSTSTGWGFITPDKGADVFIHKNELEKTGIEQLLKGQRVSFVLKIRQNGKRDALRVKIE